MLKHCPFMSFRSAYEEIYCIEEKCGLWDEERNQCCLKTQALAAAAKPSVETKPIYFDIGHPPLQDPNYTPPHNTNGTGNPYRIEGSSVCNTDDMIKKLNIKTNLFEGGSTEWI